MEIIQLSLVNDYLFCPRRAALKLVEGIRSANVHTVKGDQIHEHADTPGYENTKGTQVWRALPVWSKRFGLSGKCDIVEARLNTQTRGSPVKPTSIYPVEYKKGKRRQFGNDDAQLCAQAICLEEMFGINIPSGAIFHAASQRRREVQFTPELRAITENTIEALHQLLETQTTSPAIHKSQCAECSLYENCLPEFTSRPTTLKKASRDLFDTDD